MRLSGFEVPDLQRRLLYGCVATLFATGAAYYFLHDPNGMPYAVEPWLMKLHGAVAMLMLGLFGAMVAQHVILAWKSGMNRASGIMMLVMLGILIVTGYLLYYAGSDLRSIASNSHVLIGFAFPLGIALHIVAARRQKAALRDDTMSRRMNKRFNETIGEPRR